MDEAKEPVAEAKPRKIAMIGKAPDSVRDAPYGDADWEVWILNTLGHMNEVPRWDRQFELHDLKLIKVKEYGDYFPWICKQTRPVYLRDAPPPEIPAGVQYPLAEIQHCFEAFAGRSYLTNTVSLMVALALYEHVQGMKISDLGLWGVNMAQHGVSRAGNSGPFTSEYARQRPSVEYWLGVANGMGIKVHLPPQSDIMKSACIYGYHTTDAQQKRVVREKELQGRIQHAQQREQSAHDEAIYLSGALEGMGYDFQWVPGGDMGGGANG